MPNRAEQYIHDLPPGSLSTEADCLNMRAILELKKIKPVIRRVSGPGLASKCEGEITNLKRPMVLCSLTRSVKGRVLERFVWADKVTGCLFSVHDGTCLSSLTVKA